MKKFAALCSAFLLWSAAARAAEARLAAVTGKVTVQTGENPAYEAKKGDPVYFGDKITTGAGALAHVVFKDGAAVLVKSGSSLTVEGKPDDRLINFSVGEFLIGLKKKLTAGQRFRVKTPAAVAAVRGTLFWGLSDPATKDTTYACFESKIEIAAGGKTVLLTPGQKVKIPYNAAPDAVASAADIPADYVNTFKAEGTLQGLESLMPAPAPAAPAPAAPAAPTETAPDAGASQ